MLPKHLKNRSKLKSRKKKEKVEKERKEIERKLVEKEAEVARLRRDIAGKQVVIDIEKLGSNMI